MSDWLERLRGLLRSQERAPETAQSRRVEAALLDRSLFPTEARRLAGVARAIGDESLDPRTLEILASVLEPPGFEEELGDEESAAHLTFWRDLVARRPEDVVLAAHLSEVELALGDAEARATAVRRLVDLFDDRPELFVELGWDLEDEARAAGPDVRFRWQVHQLRWFLQAAAEHVAEQGESRDEAREIYGELLDEYRDEPARLAVLRPLGDEIRRLEVAGDLPRAMVVRRRRTT